MFAARLATGATYGIAEEDAVLFLVIQGIAHDE